MLPHSNGSEGSFHTQEPDEAAAAMGADHGRSRRSRAGAGGRLRDLLQQEAKDLRVSYSRVQQNPLNAAHVACTSRQNGMGGGTNTRNCCVHDIGLP
jgi:hypothetical protein